MNDYIENLKTDLEKILQIVEKPMEPEIKQSDLKDGEKSEVYANLRDYITGFDETDNRQYALAVVDLMKNINVIPPSSLNISNSGSVYKFFWEDVYEKVRVNIKIFTDSDNTTYAEIVESLTDNIVTLKYILDGGLEIADLVDFMIHNLKSV